MAQVSMKQNMGLVDRLIRGILGSALLVHGILALNNASASGGKHKKHAAKPDGKLGGNVGWYSAEVALGGVFLIYGLTGVDPVFSAYGVSSHAGDKNNLVNRIKKMKSGQRFQLQSNFLENAIPKKRLERFARVKSAF